MSIETLDDWNARLVCCCDMPGCPTPIKTCESKTASRDAVGWTFLTWRAAVGIGFVDGFTEDDLTCPEKSMIFGHVFQSTTVTYSNPMHGGPDTATLEVTVDIGAEYTIDGYPSPITQVGTTFAGGPVNSQTGSSLSGSEVVDLGGGDTMTVTGSIDFSSPILLADVLAEATARLDALTIGDDVLDLCYAGYLVEYTFCDEVETEQVARVTLTESRYRWQVPTDHLGTYFLITWDVYFFPTAGDPVAVDVDLTEEWAGPGTGDQSDSSWDVGTWYSLAVPTEPGQHRVVNVRYICRHGNIYGTKPQTTGEAVA